MSLLLADCERERQAFSTLLEPVCPKRVLLLKGESGSGKTQLLNYCLSTIEPLRKIYKIHIDLKSIVDGVTEIFSRSGHQLEWKNLPLFEHRVADLGSVPRVQIDGSRLVGFNNSIHVVLNSDRLADREQLRSELTEPWFQDLAALEYPILIALDTFEQATTEVKNWIGGPFLARVARLAKLRVIIAGQEVPNENNIEWGNQCATYSLRGVRDPQHWLPIVQAMQRQLNCADPVSALWMMCEIYDGRPQQIMQILEGLPLAEV